MLISPHQTVTTQKGTFLVDWYQVSEPMSKNQNGLSIDNYYFINNYINFLRASFATSKYVIISKFEFEKSLCEIEFTETVKNNDQMVIIPQRLKNQLENINFMEMIKCLN
jgi:hypothetical protein